MTFRNSGDLQNLEEEKRIFQRELSTWSKKIPLIVGFEAVAEALFGQQASNHFLNRTTNVDHPLPDDSNGKLSSTSIEDVSRVSLTSELESNLVHSQSESGSNKMEDDDWSFDFPLDLRTPEKIFNQSMVSPSQWDPNVHQLSVNNDQHQHNDTIQRNKHHYHHQSLRSLIDQSLGSSSIDRSSHTGTAQSSNENFGIGKCQSATKHCVVGGAELMDRGVSKQTTFHGSEDSNADEKKHELENPSKWKNERESLDFTKIEKFRNGESHSEETRENPLFSTNENIGHLIMSVIAKNILEKYRQVTNHHDDGIVTEDPLTPPPTMMMMMMKSEEQMHTSVDRPLDLASYPGLDASVASHGNAFQRGHLDSKTGRSSNLPDNKWCGRASPNASSSNLTSAKKSRPKRGQYRRYNRQLLLEAVRAVQQGDMSVHRAGSYFGVPHSTLEYKVKERHLLRNKKSSQDRRLRNGYLVGNDKNVPPFPVRSSPPCRTFSCRGLAGDAVPTFSKVRKESELAAGLQGTAGDPRYGYGHPFYNEVIMRNKMFYSGMFEGLPASYGWLAPRFSKSPFFPLVYPTRSAVFVPRASEQIGSASDLLVKLNPCHVSATSSSSSSSSSIAASKNTGSGEDSSEPHSTSSFEVDLRVKVTSED